MWRQGCRAETGKIGRVKNGRKRKQTRPCWVKDFPEFSLLTRLKASEGFPAMQTLCFFHSLSFISFSLLALKTPRRTRRHELNVVFQGDNLSSAEERLCKIPSHSASPWGDTNSLSPLSPSGWIAMMLTACTESFVWQIEKRMLTLDRLWHCVYQTQAEGKADLYNISQSSLQSISAHKQSPKEIVILFWTRKRHRFSHIPASLATFKILLSLKKPQMVR